MCYLRFDYCPICFAKDIAAVSVKDHQHSNDPSLYTLFLLCPTCEKGLSAIVKCKKQPYKSPHDHPPALSMVIWEVLEKFPAFNPPEAPAHVPDDIKLCFIEGVTCLRNECWSAAGLTFRKTLEMAVTKLTPNTKGTLHDLIDLMRVKNILTPSLCDWAHAIRLAGNLAAHDKITKEDAIEIFELLNPFLMYTFTLPALLEKRQNRGNKSPV